jgi:dTDP-4-amino-4,6-dideoxygalactose transaminase
VDIGGIPCNYERIYEIVERKKSLFHPANKIQEAIGHVIVVADSAHAVGASYHGKMAGAVADFTNFSFHAVKNFTTAEGGAMTWKSISGIDDNEIYHQAQLLSLHGQSKDAFAKNSLGSWEYDIVGPWYKCNMTDIQAAIGLAQLKRYKEMLQKRKSIIERYNDAFSTLPVRVLNHYTNEYVSSGHLYIMRITGATEDERNSIIIKMAEKGVATNVHYKPLPMFTAYNNLGFSMNNYHSAYSFYSNEITLPLYSLLSYEDTECVIDAFIECLRGFVV